MKMSNKGLWALMVVAACVWWACIILSGMFFSLKATALVIIGGLAAVCGLMADQKMDEAGDGE